ncbi:MAG: 4-(cytidine 5'-diphospho)-2-C-methyl-D-erythritol kinase [Rhodothalassiaceae bacterium]
MSADIARPAPAKLNLFLHLTGRRSDGYHLLQSLFAFTDAGDTITLSAAERLSLQVTGPFANALADAGGSGADNLVVRAAERLRARLGETRGAHIVLDKQLPVAAGIGGGSSDAAAALTGLIQLWGADLPSAELATLALDLGADVPACLNDQPKWVEGIGEQLHSVDGLPAFDVVLVNPGLPLSTGAVFAHRADKALPYSDPISPAQLRDILTWLRDRTRNDLQAAAIDIMPAIADILSALAAEPGCALARMSGSGPTCFGLFRGRDEARAAAARLRRRFTNGWVIDTKIRADLIRRG